MGPWGGTMRGNEGIERGKQVEREGAIQKKGKE
jgi:hypothetical protein